MGKLSNMAVGRVDGVDRPAIRKRFVLVKSEDAATEVEKDYKGAATAVVEAIAKEGVSFSEETMELLKTLVATLELDVEFAAKSDEDDGDDAADGDDDDDNGDEDGDDVAKTYTADEAEALVADALVKAGVDPQKLVAKNDDGTPESRAARITPVKKSKQPKTDEGTEERTVRKGTGLYSNIINGAPTTPYSA